METELITSIIIEDEKNNADLLAHFVKKYCPIIDLAAVSLTKKEAIAAIETHQPQLLFLDIVLDEGTAFELLEEVDTAQMQIIFITAFDEFALKAFRYNAVDYILKPIQIDELIKAVERVRKHLENQDFIFQEQIHNLNDSLQEKNPLKFVTISNIDKVNFVKSEDILYCNSSGRYTEFHLKDKRKLVASKSLGDYEDILDSSQFYRIHKSYIVNLQYIVSINKKAGNYCELVEGSSLPISRRRLDALIQFIKIM